MSMLTFLHQVKRLCYRLVCWINYPTPRERMWHMFYCGKVQGRREALKELPITQVQPRQETEPLSLQLPTGQWMREWLATHPEHRVPLPSSQPAYWPWPIERFPAWQSSKPVKASLPDTTEEMPAVVKLLHERRHETRKLG